MCGICNLFGFGNRNGLVGGEFGRRRGCCCCCCCCRRENLQLLRAQEENGRGCSCN